MLVLIHEKHFFRKMFWRIQRCKNTECRSIVFLSKKDIKYEKNAPIYIIMGYTYSYGYYCPKCGEYNYISNSKIPKSVQRDITFKTLEEEVMQIIKERTDLIGSEENKKTDETK